MPHKHFYLEKVVSKKDFLNFNPRLYYSGLVCDEPKWSVSKHAHSFCEIIYICQGSGLFIINGMEHHVTQGDIVIYNNGEYHEEFSDPDHPLKTYFFGVGNNDSYNDIDNIAGMVNNDKPEKSKIRGTADETAIKDDFCPLLFLFHLHSPVIHSGIYTEAFEKYIIELVYESSIKSFGFDTICSNVLSSMFVIIRRIIISDTNDESVQISTKVLISNNIIEYIKSNRHQSLTVNDIAKHFYISKDYLAHIFKNETGISPINYLLMLKIDEAKRLLSTTEKTISEISVLIGYDDANYVSQLFKKMTGVSPSQFRISSKQNV